MIDLQRVEKIFQFWQACESVPLSQVWERIKPQIINPQTEQYSSSTTCYPGLFELGVTGFGKREPQLSDGRLTDENGLNVGLVGLLQGEDLQLLYHPLCLQLYLLEPQSTPDSHMNPFLSPLLKALINTISCFCQPGYESQGLSKIQSSIQQLETQSKQDDSTQVQLFFLRFLRIFIGLYFGFPKNNKHYFRNLLESHPLSKNYHFSFYHDLAILMNCPRKKHRTKPLVNYYSEFIAAEVHRLNQDPWQSFQAYENFLEQASQDRAFLLAALGSERASSLYYQGKIKRAAQSYLEQAQYFYEKCFAYGKVEQVKQQADQWFSSSYFLIDISSKTLSKNNNFQANFKPVTEGKKIIGNQELTTTLNNQNQYLSTEIELKNTQLQASYQRFNIFFQQSLYASFFCMLDQPILWNDQADKNMLLDYVFSHQKITDVNAAFLQQYGVTKENIIGKTPQDFFPDNIDHGKQLWRSLFDQGTIYVETQECKVDGTQIWIEGSYICLYDEQGRITGHFGSQKDITHRKQAEQALQTQERQQAAIALLGQLALKTPDLQDLMDQIVHLVSHVLGVEYCKLLELLPNETMLLKAGVGWQFGLVGVATVGTDFDSQAGYTLRSDKPVVVEDLTQETRFHNSLLLQQHGVKSGMSVVISGLEQPYGVLGVHTQKLRQFSPEDVQFLHAIALMLSTAITRYNAEIALRHSEATNRALLNGVPDMIFRTTQEGIFLDFKPAKGTPPLFPPEEFIGRNFREIFPPEMSEKVAAAYQRAIASRTVQTLQYQLPNQGNIRNSQQGALKDYEARIVTCGNNEILCIVRDITPQQNALRENEKAQAQIKFQASLLAQVRQGVIATDLEGKVIYANAFVEELYGYSPESLIGKEIFQITVPPEEQVRSQEIIQGIAEKGYWEGEFRVQRADGSRFLAYVINTLIRDETGEAIAVLGLSNDISDRAQAQEKLKRSEARYELATRAAKVGVWEWNLQRGEFYLDPNLKAMLGYSDAEIPNDLEVWVSYVHPEDQEKVMAATYAHLAGKTPEYTCEHRMLHKNGSVCWILVRGQAFRNDQGEVLYMVGTDTDITDRKETELALAKAKEEAEAANHAKSTFLTNMSHELRSPLHAILGFTQLLEREPNLTPTQKDHLNTIYRSGKHLLALINEILDLSKIEAGQMAVDASGFDLAKLLEEVEAMFSLKAAEKGLTLLFDVETALPQRVKSDRLKLRQVLVNLLSNAIKFTQTGEIVVTVEVHKIFDKQIQLGFKVSDTGSGIAPEDLHKLFQPFVQTETGLTSGEGTGLGLTISAEYVRLLGGEITVESHLGEGTTFQFNISAPILPDTVEYPHTKLKVVGLAPAQPQYRILVVDDRASNRQFLVQLLTKVGFQVFEAANGEEAVKLWAEINPDLIWMDMRMPGMNGYQATTQIRQQEQKNKQKPIPILALTANAFEEQKLAVFAAGCDDFIAKPISESLLLRKIAQFLGVRYCYQKSVELIQDPTPTRLTPQMLQTLPSSVRHALAEAIFDLELDTLHQVVDQIEQKYPAIARTLKVYIQQYQYDEIVQILQDIEP